MPTFLWLHDPPHHFGDNLFPTLLRLFPLHFSVISGPLPIFVITCPPLLWLHAPTLIFVNTCFLLFIISSPMNFVSTGSLYFLCLHILGGGVLYVPLFSGLDLLLPILWLYASLFHDLCFFHFCDCVPPIFVTVLLIFFITISTPTNFYDYKSPLSIFGDFTPFPPHSWSS